MKKELLLIAAAATMLTACVNTEDFRDVNIQQNSENDGAIGFTSFTDNVTKAENSEALYTWTFYNHQESFQVWGRKSNQIDHEIFGGTKVSVSRDGSVGNYTYTYRYAPSRFWDKSAPEYHFYAAAPARNDATGTAWKWTFVDTNIDANDVSTINQGYFKIMTNAFALNGVNLKHADNGGADEVLDNVFKGITVSEGNDDTDTDLLIAAPARVTKTYYNKPAPDAVNLNFIHILSKLNITISTSLGTLTEADDGIDHTYNVDLLAFELHNIPSAGTFDESSATLNSANQNKTTEHRWARSGTSIIDIETGITSSAHVDVPITTDGKLYIVESLIMPQDITYERVALDGLDHTAVNQTAVPYQTYEEYETAKHNDANRLSQAAFEALIVDGASGKTFADGISDANKAEITKIPELQIAAYSAPTKPYLTITYSIDGDEFTANYNLAAAFLGYNNNNQKYEAGVLTDLDLDGEDDNDDPTTFSFYEGWQNTLNIIINPTAIEFTADVAEWSTNADVEYEIEQGNENP